MLEVVASQQCGGVGLSVSAKKGMNEASLGLGPLERSHIATPFFHQPQTPHDACRLAAALACHLKTLAWRRSESYILNRGLLFGGFPWVMHMLSRIAKFWLF